MLVSTDFLTQRIRETHLSGKGRSPIVELKQLPQAKKLHNGGFCTFDVETKDGLVGKELFCWSVAKFGPGGTYEVLQSQQPDFERLMDFCKPNKRTKGKRGNGRTIYVHNLEFDARFLADWAVRNNIKFSAVRSHRLLCLTFHDYNIRFVDSFQFLLCSQERAEIDFGVDEELRKIDCHQIFTREYSSWSDSDKQQVLDHNANDVKALLQIMHTFRREWFEIANVDLLQAISLPSLAMKAFRKKMNIAMPNPFVYLNFSGNGKAQYMYDARLDASIRESYRGGRTEVFTEGPVGDVDVWDVVSLYPGVMHSKQFPIGLGEITNDLSRLDAAIDGDESVEGFVSVTYTAPQGLLYPILPTKVGEGINEKLVFSLEPCTEPTIFALPELRFARQLGYEITAHNGILFEPGRPFVDFVEEFFAIKSNSVGPKRSVAKLALNSTYGKFGQKFTEDRPYYKTGDMYEVMEDESLVSMKNLPGTEFWIGVGYEESTVTRPFQNVAIASYVTSHARVELAKAVLNCDDHGVRVYYTDTDSIHVPHGADISFLNPSKDLGAWDLEHEYEGACYLAPKVYIAKEKAKFKIAFKGVPKVVLQEIIDNNQTLETILEELRKPIDIPERYCTFHEGMLRGQPLSSKTLTKEHTFANEKRVFAKDGSSVPLGWKGRG